MIDQLIKRIEYLKNPSVVGLDPTYEMMPDTLKDKMIDMHGATPYAVSEMFFEFNKAIIDAIKDIVPAVKPQIAMYEQYGIEGLNAYVKTTKYAKDAGLIVIGDIKRGDIASTAAAYAGHIDGVEIEGNTFDSWHEDFITINPYLGSDGIDPFTEVCEKKDKGIFVLVRTSNPSSAEIQEGIYTNVGELVSKWGESTRGEYGYSKVGAVVGATQSEEGKKLRELMPHTFFLVPGYGAQGATATDLKDFFDSDGRGSIINSSRGIIAAWKKDGREDFACAARDAALQMKKELGELI